MRVAIFTDNDFDKVNGVTTTLRAVLQFSQDVQPRIYTAADLGIDTPTYFATASIGMGLPWYREMRIYWPRLISFARALERDGVDVIHVTTPGPIGVAGRWLAARLGVPLVGSYHTHLGDYAATFSGSPRLGRVLDRYLQWCYKTCDPLLVPSLAARDHLASRGYRADRLIVWGRGVDTSKFSPARASQTLRNTWHVDARRPAILYAGRLSREKGLDLIEPLQRRLHRHGLAHQFVFAGDGPMRSAVEAMCPDGVFLGKLPHDRVAVTMASCDLFLFPSATDTLGNVVLEAQAAGLPVIVSNRGGPQQQVASGTTGFVCQAGDANGFADAVIALLHRPERRAAMSREARKHAETHDWPRSLEPLHAAWHSAAARRASVAARVAVGPAHSAAARDASR
jgi:glycosyltransferase involved in cell wall biosynthesis